MKQVLMNGTVITPKSLDPEAMKQQAKQIADEILENEGIKVIGVDSIGDISESTSFSGNPVYEISLWYNIEEFKPELGNFPHNTRQGDGVVFWIHFMEDGEKVDFKKEKVEASLKTLLKVANINGEKPMKNQKRSTDKRLLSKAALAKKVKAKKYTEEEWKYAEKMRSGNTKVYADESGLISIQLYDTVIAKVNPNTHEVVLNSGGHLTPTTKRKMNQVLQLTGINGQVFQKNGHWYVDINGNKEDFTEGMTVMASKKVEAMGGDDEYESIVFLQGSEADEVLDILNDRGEDAAMDFLMQWDMGEGGEVYDTPPWGSADELYKRDNYVMSYNTGLPAFGLTRVVDGTVEDELDATKSGNVVIKDAEGNIIKSSKKVKAQGKKDVGFAINVYLDSEAPDDLNPDEVTKDAREVELRALKFLEKFGTPREEGHDRDDHLVGTLFFDAEIPEEIQESMDIDEPLRTSSGTLSDIELLDGLALADHLGVDIEFFEGMQVEEEAPASPVMAKKKTKAELKKLHAKKKVKAAAGEANFQFYYDNEKGVEMSGRGLTKASYEGEEGDVDSVLQAMVEAIGEDIPEFHVYEISLYIEGGYGGYTFNTDYSNDNEPPEDVLEKIWQWLATETSIDPEKTPEPSKDIKNLGVRPASKKVKAQDDPGKYQSKSLEKLRQEGEIGDNNPKPEAVSEEGPDPEGEMFIHNNSKFTDEELAPTIREILSKEGFDLDEDVEIEDIWWADTGFEMVVGGMEFYVIPHADADAAAKEYLTNDEEELVATVNDWVITDNFDDKAFFSDIEDDEIEANVEWIRDDEPDLDYDQAREKAEEYWNDRVENMTALEYLSDIYGEEDAKQQMARSFSNYIDIDGIADDIINIDGRGHTLAGYDGEEREIGNWFYYRWN